MLKKNNHLESDDNDRLHFDNDNFSTSSNYHSEPTGSYNFTELENKQAKVQANVQAKVPAEEPKLPAEEPKLPKQSPKKQGFERFTDENAENLDSQPNHN
jgi:hypothetical protein